MLASLLRQRRSVRVPSKLSPKFLGLSNIKFNSTVATETANQSSENATTEKSQDGAAKKPFQRRKFQGPHTVDLLKNVVEDENLNITEKFTKYETILSQADKSYISSPRFFYSSTIIGHKLMNSIAKYSKNNANSSIPVSLLFDKFLRISMEKQLLQVSQGSRAVTELLSEKQYTKALSLWVELLEYFNKNPQGFEQNPKFERTVDKESFFATGLATYILTCHFNKAPIDEVFISSMIGDNTVPFYRFQSVFPMIKSLTAKEKETLIGDFDLIKSYKHDPNDLTTWKNATLAATEQKSDLLNKLIGDIRKNAERRNITFTEPTYVKLMQLYSLDGNYKMGLSIWTEMQNENIEPSLDAWNQLLEIHGKLNLPQKSLRIESVWKLLNEKFEPNSDSYAALIRGYISAKDTGRALGTVSDLKKEGKVKVTDEIRESILIGLLNTGMSTQAEKLYQLYLKESEYKPSIKFYNSYLSALLKSNDLDKASHVIEQLVSTADVQPDIATYTIIIDVLMKRARRKRTEFDGSILIDLFTSMEKRGLTPSEKTLTVFMSNLLKNESTVPLGRLVFDYVKSKKMRISATTYTAVISGECESGDMESAMTTFHEAIQSGITLRPMFYNMILKGFLSANNIKHSIEFYNFIMNSTTPENRPNFFSYYYLLKTAINSGNNDYIKLVIDEMDKSAITKFGRAIPYLLTDVENKGIKIPEKLETFRSEFLKEAEQKNSLKNDFTS